VRIASIVTRIVRRHNLSVVTDSKRKLLRLYGSARRGGDVDIDLTTDAQECECVRGTAVAGGVLWPASSNTSLSLILQLGGNVDGLPSKDVFVDFVP
jgi:hypothetical protein